MPFLGSISPEAPSNILYPSPPMTRSSSPHSRQKHNPLHSQSASTSFSRPSPVSDYSPTSASVGPQAQPARLHPLPPSNLDISPYAPHLASAFANTLHGAHFTTTGSSPLGKPLVSCEPCKKAHLKCQNKRPCDRCIRGGKENQCIDVIHKDRGRPPKDPKKVEARAAARVVTELRQQEQAAFMRSYPFSHAQAAGLVLAPTAFTFQRDLQQGPPSDHMMSDRPTTSNASYNPPYFGRQATSAYDTYRGHSEQSVYGVPTLPRPGSYVPPTELPAFPRPPDSMFSPSASTPGGYPRQSTTKEAYEFRRPPHMAFSEHGQRVEPSQDAPGIHLSSPIRQSPTSASSLVQDESLRLPPLRSPGLWDTHSDQSGYNHNDSQSQKGASQTRPNLTRVQTGPLPQPMHPPSQQSPSHLYQQSFPSFDAPAQPRYEMIPQMRRLSEQAVPTQTRPAFETIPQQPERDRFTGLQPSFPLQFSTPQKYAEPPCPQNVEGSKALQQSTDGFVRDRASSSSNSGAGNDLSIDHRSGKKRRKVDLRDIVD